jgi:hypothetical protein
MSFTTADYCESESKAQGTTPEQYKAALHLVTTAMKDTTNVDIADIEVTKDGVHYHWRRLKWLKGKSTFRAIIEIQDTGVILHLVIPRASDTYEEVKKLWLKHRTKMP